MKEKGKAGCGPKWGWQRKEGAPGWPAPPWARFMPFGPGGGGGSRGPRMFAQGDLRLLLLALIADKPSHGYDLIRTIEARFNGNYAPSPGTIYPTLTLLEEQEFIEPEADGGSKKSYRATAKGLEYLQSHTEAVKALMTRIDIMADTGTSSPRPALMAAIHTLRAAVMSKSVANPEEQDRVQQIIEQAARDIMSGKR